MKKLLFSFIMALMPFLVYSQCGDLYIAGAIDGPLSGGVPKAIQLCASADISDLSLFGIESVTNGGGSNGAAEYTFPADAISSGDCIWVATESAMFSTYFGFAPCYESGTVNVNGDDALVLYCNGAATDVLGDPNTDGSGTTWEYADGWISSNDMVGNATFDDTEWTYSGANALDGATDNGSSASPYPTATANCPTSSTVPGCMDATACNFDATATMDDGSCYAVGDNCDDGDATTGGDVYTDCATCAGTPGTPGCMDAAACNFDSAATIDDGSCFSVGDSCDDGDGTTVGDVYTDCTTCAGMVAGPCSLYIAGAIDGPLSGGVPKGIQLCATADIADLSQYGIESVTNGGGSNGAAEYTFPADAISSGECIWVATESAMFSTYFGFAPCYESGTVNVNGDDALVLYCNGVVTDVLGDPNTDGSGTAWEYADGWIASSDMVGNATFDETEWTYSGANALDGATDNGSSASPYPTATANCPTSSTVPGCMDATACNFDATATMDDGSCYAVGDNCDDGDATTGGDVYTDCATCAGTPGTPGCMDAAACNFDSAATIDDGSCFSVGDSCDDGDANTVGDVYTDCSTCAGAVAGPCSLYIAGAIDGPLSGGLPKAIQLCATADISDLSQYGIESVTNGGGSNGAEEYTFPADAISSGDCIWVATESAMFTTYFGFSPCYESGTVNVNGDDALVLYCNGVVTDVLGDPNTDGSGTAWEYADGWIASSDMIGNATFDETEWTYSGANALDGAADNGSSASPYPTATANCPTSSTVLGCMDATACNFDETATMDDGSCYAVGDNCDDGDATTGGDVYTDCATCAGTPGTPGCMDAAACNFDSAATIDDGSCFSVGDSCDDGDATTVGDVYTDCTTCAGILPGPCSLYIAGAIDGPLSGGVPKGIQLCATADIADLSQYGIESVTNGGGSNGTEEYTFPADAILSGECIWVATESEMFSAYFGFAPCYESGTVNVNGDDALVLYCNGVVTDVLGDPDTDGSGTAWEYADGWIASSDMVGNATFDETEWTYSGANALDGAADNGSSASPYPTATANCPTSSTVLGCMDATACNFDETATMDDGSCYAVGDSCDDDDPLTGGDVYTDCATCIGMAGTPGCMDAAACNFDSAATIDDGSCFSVGDSCDDGDINTVDDVYTDCSTCEGTPFTPGDLYISEISYNPCTEQGADGECEYIVITNTSANAIDISDYTISNGLDYTFPAGTMIAANGSISLGVGACASFTFDLSGDWMGNLGNGGETIELNDATGTLLSTVTYDGTIGDGDCEANCFDAAGTSSSCTPSVGAPVGNCDSNSGNFPWTGN